MAFISTETVANIRKALKDEFGKGYKFSVRKGVASTSVTVCILKSPFFEDGVTQAVNQYYIKEHYADNPDQVKFLTRVNELIKEVGGWWDKSDSMVDYFHTSFYYYIEVGQWNRPHVKTEG